MSRGEELLLAQVKEAGLPDPIGEFRFWPGRRFRFDFCWPDRMVACEVEGGAYSGGRHVRGKGYEGDCVKYSEAAIRGWRVVRVTTQMVEKGEAIQLLRRILELPAHLVEKGPQHPNEEGHDHEGADGPANQS